MYFAGSTGTAVSDWISLSEGLKYMCLLIHIVLVGRSSETLWNHKLYFILFDRKKKALHFHELIAFQDAHVIQSLGYFPSWILAAIGRESIVLVKRIFQSRPLFAISRFIWWGMESGTRLIDWSVEGLTFAVPRLFSSFQIERKLYLYIVFFCSLLLSINEANNGKDALIDDI
jgi:hypothetical protein